MDNGISRAYSLISQCYLSRDDQKKLDKLFDIVRNSQVSRKKVESFPTWLVDKALQEELEEMWRGAYTVVPEHIVRLHASIIGSRVVYRIKVEGNENLSMLAFFHAKITTMRREISETTCQMLSLTHLLLSTAITLDLRFESIDVKGAYLQSGPITLDIYVRSPVECNHKRLTLWKLNKSPYGISEAGRQWTKAIDSWMMKDAKLLRVSYVSQLYMKKHTDDNRKCFLQKKPTIYLWKAL